MFAKIMFIKCDKMNRFFVANNDLTSITDGTKVVFPHAYTSDESKANNYDPLISLQDHHQYMNSSSLVLQSNNFLNRHIK